TRERDRMMQEFIAACMKDEGFEYYPVIHDAGISFPLPIPDEGAENLWEPDKREWVAEYGYGIVNNPYRQGGGWGIPEPMPLPEPIPIPDFDDPNMEYF